MEIKKIKGAGYKTLEIALKNLETKKVGKVGWFRNAKYENGVPVARVATTQEYGNPAKHIPPRPFFRPTIGEQANEWRGIANAGAKEILKGNQSGENVINIIAKKAAGDVKKKITEIYEPPLSPRTIQARLNRKTKKTIGLLTKPLIDTGIMLNTLLGEVEPE